MAWDVRERYSPQLLRWWHRIVQFGRTRSQARSRRTVTRRWHPVPGREQDGWQRGVRRAHARPGILAWRSSTAPGSLEKRTTDRWIHRRTGEGSCLREMSPTLEPVLLGTGVHTHRSSAVAARPVRTMMGCAQDCAVRGRRNGPDKSRPAIGFRMAARPDPRPARRTATATPFQFPTQRRSISAASASPAALPSRCATQMISSTRSGNNATQVV